MVKEAEVGVNEMYLEKIPFNNKIICIECPVQVVQSHYHTNHIQNEPLCVTSTPWTLVHVTPFELAGLQRFQNNVLSQAK